VQTVADLTEAELIDRIRQKLPPRPEWLLVDIGDDAAVVTPARNRLEVLTVDAIVDGVHVDRRFTPAAAIGYRAVAVNLSDLAAMGAEPRLALLSLGLPADVTLEDFDSLVGAAASVAARHQLHLVGGNLTRTPGPLVVDVTAAGSVKARQVLTRSGARPGDELYLTGTIGAAAAGLEMLRENVRRADLRRADLLGPPDPPTCVDRYLYPEPRLRAGLLLGRNRAATACIDLSDGLGDAVRRLAESSGVGAVVDASVLPIDPEADRWFGGRGTDPVGAAISRGDDYELLFTVRPRRRGALKAVSRHGGTPLTRIGVCTENRALLLRRDGSDQPLPAGYDHFR
jgi:thiamine-monophosphate kinase